MKYFDTLEELIEFYKKEYMGLVWHLKYAVQREEEDAGDEPEEDAGEISRGRVDDMDPRCLL